MTESSTIFEQWRDDNGFHLLCVDRPGYGQSSSPVNDTQQQYGYVNFAQDIADLLRALHITTNLVGVLGHSSGGPYALAVAALVEGCGGARCVLVASDVEYANPLAAQLGIKDPLLGSGGGPVLDVDPDCTDLAAGFAFATPRELHELDKDGALAVYRNSVRRSTHTNNAGARLDYVCERRPWGFSFAAPYSAARVITVAVGDCDAFCHPPHAYYSFFQQWAASAAVVDLQVFPTYGHFDIVLHPAAQRRLLGLFKI